MPKPHPRRVTRAAAWHRALTSAASTHQHTGMQPAEPRPSSSTSSLHPSLRCLQGDGGRKGERSTGRGTGDMATGQAGRVWLAADPLPQAPGEKAGGSCRGWQCKEHAGPLRRGVQQWEREENASLPPVNTALRGARSLLPLGSRRRHSLGTRPAAGGPGFGRRAGVTPRPRRARSRRGS